MIKAVMGLGNPGAKYLDTRHNVGFKVVDLVAERHGATFKRGWRIRGESCKILGLSRPVLLVKPQTFMNRSGDCVRAVRRRHKLQPEEILVVVDDVDLPLGRLRLRGEGRSGGHNGLRSVEERLGSSGYPRLRVGVGERPAGRDLVEFVLSSFDDDEVEQVRTMVEHAADAVVCALEQDVASAMNKFNERKTPDHERRRKSEAEQ